MGAQQRAVAAGSVGDDLLACVDSLVGVSAAVREDGGFILTYRLFGGVVDQFDLLFESFDLSLQPVALVSFLHQLSRQLDDGLWVRVWMHGLQRTSALLAPVSWWLDARCHVVLPELVRQVHDAPLSDLIALDVLPH